MDNPVCALSRKRLKTALSASLLALSFGLLTGCGGGGGGSSSGSGSAGGISTSPPPSDTALMTLTGDTSAVPGDSVGIVASFSKQGFQRFEWEQLSGPAVPLPGDGTAGISFDVPASGNYSFRLTATNIDGSTVAETFDLSVAGTSGSTQVQFRADRAVSEGAEFSLRLNATKYVGTVNDWSFSQVSGPAATLQVDDSEQPVVFVTAPNVNVDTVLTFEAALETTEGTFTDLVYVVVQDRPAVTSEYFCAGSGQYCASDSPLNNVYTYRADSPFRERLASCVFSNQLDDNNLCTLTELPLIGLRSSAPSVDLIMEHVLVSHDWMGERFETFLRSLDPYSDFANMLRATTAVVISSEIRPSFYWSLTGAIYLDPDSLWLTAEERDVINEQPDFRSGFGSTLNFVTPWRYVKNNNYAFTGYAISQRYSRSLLEIEADLGSLLYHELAHANDVMPQSKLNSGLDQSDIFFNQAQSGVVVNETVSAINPLQSAELFALADVRYRGAEASAQQQAYTPADIAGFFFPDSASDFYAYSTDYEDLAMLFEETMMSLRYQIQRDIAVTNKPVNPTSADSYIVSQGQRNRVGSDLLRPRASTAVQHLLPEAWAAADEHLKQLTPIALCSGEGWGQNLNPTCGSNSGLLRFTAPLPSSAVPMPELNPRHQHPPMWY